jgi:hypothetical protein
VPAVDPDGRQAGLLGRDVVVEQALRHVQQSAFLDAKAAGLGQQGVEVPW